MDSIYASAFNIIISNTDIRIDFMRVEPVTDDAGAVVSEERIPGQRIALTIPLAKELASKLTQLIQDNEENSTEQSVNTNE